MTDRSRHVSDEELADHDVGLLSAERDADVGEHLTGCQTCTDALDRIRHVSRVLAAQPVPAIPPAVVARLDETLRTLARDRTSGRPGGGSAAGDGSAAGVRAVPGGQGSRLPAPTLAVTASGSTARDLLRAPRPTIGTLEEGLRRTARGRRRPGRVLAAALGACVVAGAVGFGGYLLSAVSGHNEPSADSPLVVTGDRLGESSAVENHSGLSPHRFSEAWTCARKVTDGRITGIEASVVNRTPGLLVYLVGAAGTTRVVFVSGCDTGEPTAGPSAVLPKR